MKARVYLETSVVSYLASRPSHDLIVAAHQALSLEWWDARRHDFEIVASVYVLEERAQGDADAATRRLALIEGVAIVPVSVDTEALAAAFLTGGALPREARLDALHIACAALNGVDYLLTWNCKRIANFERLPAVERICSENGYEPPRICTPAELMGDR